MNREETEQARAETAFRREFFARGDTMAYRREWNARPLRIDRGMLEQPAFQHPGPGVELAHEVPGLESFDDVFGEEWFEVAASMASTRPAGGDPKRTRRRAA